MIYLFSSDGHRDSVDLTNYTTNEQGLKLFAENHINDIYYDRVIINHEVDFNTKQIKTTYIDKDTNETEIMITHFFTLTKI